MKTHQLIGVLLAIAAASALVVGQGAKSPAKGAVPKTTQFSFIRTPIGSSEMTVELPGKAKEIAVPLEEKIRASYDILQTIGVATDELAAFASYAVSRGNKPISLDGAARGALDRVKSQAQAQDYKESITSALVVGLPARRINCTFTSGERRMFLSGVLFTDRTRMWQVICTGAVSTSNSNVASRVLASVKRNSAGGNAPSG